MSRIKNILLQISGVFGILMLIGLAGAQAASLTVNTTANAGPGSLRQAVLDAITNGEANIVSFNIPTSDPGYNPSEFRFTITLSSALPNIPLAPMTLDNAQLQGVTVRGNDTFRIFTLVNSAVVTINRLTISNGFGSDGSGGGIFMGNTSTLFLNLSTVSDNAAAASGGGIYMSNSSTLHLSRSTIRNNTAGNGGGIYIFDSGTLNMDASTVNANSATNGGGIYNGTSGTINGTNSTISGNAAVSHGGGILNTATTTVTDSTFAGNTAAQGGGIYNSFTATLHNNIVALNIATDGTDLFGGDPLGGSAYSGTYNLIGNADGSAGVSEASNRSGTTASPINPLIGPLQDNGGPTLTRALLAGSPAIDKGNSVTLITDQRGELRPVDQPLITNDGGNSADMGAYECQSNECSANTPTPTPTLTATATANPTATSTLAPTATPTATGTATATSTATSTTNATATATATPTATSTASATATATAPPTTATQTATQTQTQTATATPTPTSGPNSNTNPICMTTVGQADMYPSSIVITNGPMQIVGMRVVLKDFFDEIPDNVDVLVVGPNGAKYVMMADVGGTASISQANAVTLTLADNQMQVMPDDGPLTTGIFEPTVMEAGQSDFPLPAPPGPYHEGDTVAPGGPASTTFLGAFGQSNANGTWNLYVRNDGGLLPVTRGCFNGGWEIQFLTTTAARVSVSGRVTTAAGEGIRNAKMVMTGGTLGEPIIVTTGSFGYYNFDNLETGQTYILTIDSKRYTFSTPTRVISLIDNIVDADFIAQE